MIDFGFYPNYDETFYIQHIDVYPTNSSSSRLYAFGFLALK